MKKSIKRIFVFSGLLLLTSIVLESCDEDKLTQVNPNRASEDSFWQTAEDANKGIIGAYTPLTAITSYTRFRIFFAEYRSDVVNPNGTSGRAKPAFFQATPDEGGVAWAWRDSYQGIYRANEVIANVPEIDMDPGQKNGILGEAYFLRAFNYFDLVTNFQNIPLSLDPDYGVADPLEVVPSSQEDVWNQIISDLGQAEALLPTSRSGSEIGRATKASAQGYLGKAHLYKADLLNSPGDYGQAKVVFNRLIADNPGLSLVADYNDNFKDDTENNSESLFEIQFFHDGSGGWGTDGLAVRKSNNFTEDIAPKTPGGFSGQDSMTINQWVLDLFLDERTINGEIDPRAYSTIMFDSAEETNYQGNVLRSTYYEGKNYEQAFGAGSSGIFGKKFLEVEKADRKGSSFNRSNNNLRLLRLADVYLMLAEAELKSNGGASTPAAVEAVNKVRRRADMPEFTTVTMEDIMDERVKELSLEWSRYFDLLRWGMVRERIVDLPGIKSNAVPDVSVFYEPGREYMAIPIGELDKFPNLIPSPGY